jgi:predicted dehydrogenase
MSLIPAERDIEIGKENFYAAVGSPSIRQDFLLQGIRQGIASRSGLGPHYFGYGKSVPEPVRVGVIGTGDEGGVLLGAINPAFIQVKAIADARPYNIHRAFHGDYYSESQLKVRPGLLRVCKWKDEDEARKNVKVYGPYEELIAHAKEDGLEAVIIALPLHLHAAAAIAAMRAGLHVLTETLMAHSVRQCKEMARAAKKTGLYLAVGHQRHYSILYDNAVELIRRGVLGELHYIRAQWHQDDQPGNDSWRPPLPPGVKSLAEDPKANLLKEELNRYEEELGKHEKALAEAQKPKKDAEPGAKQIENLQRLIAQKTAQIAQKTAQIADKAVEAEKLGYENREWPIPGPDGKPAVYHRPAIEELIRWRLWDRTGAGLMAELGSHQLDAASIFIQAAHEGKMQHPLSVAAAANRPLFPPDRDIEDHVYCILEFPAPGYDARSPEAAKKKIGVQYASINGNGLGDYGETVLGTEGTLVLEREQDVLLYKLAATTGKTRVVEDKKTKQAKLDLVPSGDERSAAIGREAMLEAERGYVEELEHWAWCIRNPAPENRPLCHAEVALKDAVIALTANQAARRGQRIKFQDAWFDPDNTAVPPGDEKKT